MKFWPTRHCTAINVDRPFMGAALWASLINPPTPADARGSAPGNKTFSADHLEACNSNSNSNSSSSSTLLCHGVFPSGTYVFAAASGRSSWQAAAEQPAVKKQVAGSQLSAARTQQTATATAAAAVLFFGCKLWEPSGQQQAAAGSGRQPAKLQFYSRVSEVTLGPFLGFLCYVLGTKLGGVLLFRMCFEKGVWLFVSCFGGCLIAAAAQQHHSSSRQRQAAAGSGEVAIL